MKEHPTVMGMTERTQVCLEKYDWLFSRIKVPYLREECASGADPSMSEREVRELITFYLKNLKNLNRLKWSPSSEELEELRSLRLPKQSQNAIGPVEHQTSTIDDDPAEVIAAAVNSYTPEKARILLVFSRSAVAHKTCQGLGRRVSIVDPYAADFQPEVTSSEFCLTSLSESDGTPTFVRAGDRFELIYIHLPAPGIVKRSDDFLGSDFGEAAPDSWDEIDLDSFSRRVHWLIKCCAMTLGSTGTLVVLCRRGRWETRRLKAAPKVTHIPLHWMVQEAAEAAGLVRVRSYEVEFEVNSVPKALLDEMSHAYLEVFRHAH